MEHFRTLKKIYYKIKFFLKLFGFLDDFFIVSLASERDKVEIFKLRYEVYCLEKKYLDYRKYTNNLEIDEYDQYATLFICRDKRNGNIAGTARLITNYKSLQANRYLDVYKTIGTKNIAEVSRFIVAKKYRNKGHEVTFSLARKLFLYSLDNKIENWIAVIFTPNWKLFNKMQVPFIVIDSPKEWKFMPNHYVVPVLLNVKKAAIYLKYKNSLLLSYFFGRNYKVDKNKGNKEIYREVNSKLLSDWENFKNHI